MWHGVEHRGLCWGSHGGETAQVYDQRRAGWEEGGEVESREEVDGTLEVPRGWQRHDAEGQVEGFDGTHGRGGNELPRGNEVMLECSEGASELGGGAVEWETEEVGQLGSMSHGGYCSVVAAMVGRGEMGYDVLAEPYDITGEESFVSPTTPFYIALATRKKKPRVSTRKETIKKRYYIRTGPVPSI